MSEHGCNVFLRRCDKVSSLSQPTCVEHGRLNSGFIRDASAINDAQRHLDGTLKGEAESGGGWR